MQKIIDLFVVNLKEGTVDVETLSLLALELFDFLKKLIDRPGDEARVVLIGDEIFEKSVLVLLRFDMFGDGVLPVAAEHGVGLA